MAIYDIDDFDEEEPWEADSALETDFSSQEHNRSENQKYSGTSHTRLNPLTKEQLSVDWYAVLNIPRSATANEIKNAYHKRCLETHPDKQDSTCNDEDFKEVVKAFDILGDAELRKSYDSAAPFDDSIPEDRKYEANEFFDTFSVVFKRNERWSRKKMPELGDMTTPIQEVEKFYKSWSAFRSWRDFAHLVESEECADNEWREVRRRIQRERERQIEKLKMKEARRIATFVERAYRADPRIRQQIQREADEKRRIQEERESLKQKALAEEEQKKMEEENKLKQIENDAKEAKRALAARKRECRIQILQKLRELACLDESSEQSMALCEDILQIGCVRWLLSSIDDLDTFMEKINSFSSATVHELVQMVNSSVRDLEKQKGIDRYGQAIGETSKVDKEKASNSTVKEDLDIWKSEELQELQRAIAKYPAGTVDRWEKIAHFIGNTHAPKQILLKTRELEASWNILKNCTQGNNSIDQNTSAIWTATQQRQLESGLKELMNYKEKDKWEKIAGFVSGKTKADCIARYKALCSLKK